MVQALLSQKLASGAMAVVVVTLVTSSFIIDSRATAAAQALRAAYSAELDMWGDSLTDGQASLDEGAARVAELRTDETFVRTHNDLFAQFSAARGALSQRLATADLETVIVRSGDTYEVNHPVVDALAPTRGDVDRIRRTWVMSTLTTVHSFVEAVNALEDAFVDYRRDDRGKDEGESATQTPVVAEGTRGESAESASNQKPKPASSEKTMTKSPATGPVDEGPATVAPSVKSPGAEPSPVQKPTVKMPPETGLDSQSGQDDEDGQGSDL